MAQKFIGNNGIKWGHFSKESFHKDKIGSLLTDKCEITLTFFVKIKFLCVCKMFSQPIQL